MLNMIIHLKESFVELTHSSLLFYCQTHRRLFNILGREIRFGFAFPLKSKDILVI